MLEEQRPLVGVRGEVGPRRAEPRENGCDAGCRSGRQHRLAQKRMAPVHASETTPTHGGSRRYFERLDERHEHGGAERPRQREARRSQRRRRARPAAASATEYGASQITLETPTRIPTAVSTAWKAIPAASPRVNEMPCVWKAIAIAPLVTPMFPGVSGTIPATSRIGTITTAAASG